MSDHGPRIASNRSNGPIKPRRPARRKKRSAAPARDRFAYRPGNGVCAIEALEQRQLLSGDLTQTISELITGGTLSGTHNLGSVQIGSFLTIPSSTITLSNVSQNDSTHWTASVEVDASSATLAFGSVLTGAITSPTSTPALVADYTLTDQPLLGGSYSVTAQAIAVTVPSVLTTNLTGVHLAYNPAGPTGQTLVTIPSATATITPLANTSVSVTNLAVRDNGFSFDNAMATPAGDFKLGGILSVSSPSVSFSDVSYTSGQGWTPGATISASVASASLFAGQAGFTNPGGSASNANGLSLTGFKGSYNLTSNALSLSATGAELKIGSLVDATASALTIAYDPNAASPVTVTAGSLSATSSLLPGVTGEVDNLMASSAGLSTSGGSLKDTNSISLGGVLEFDSLYDSNGLLLQPAALLTLPALNYVASATNPVNLSGTVGISFGKVKILPGLSSAFSTTVDTFQASYNLGTQALSVGASDVLMTVGSGRDGSSNTSNAALTVDVKNPTFTLTPNGDGTDAVNFNVTDATVSLPKLGLSGDVTDLTVTNDGFHVGSLTLAKAGPVSAFGGAFMISDPSVTLTGFGYSKSAGAQFNSDLTVTATSAAFNQHGTVSVVATGGVPGGATLPLSAKIHFQTVDGALNLGDFTFTAGTITATFGSYLTLTGTGIKVDTQPAHGGDFVDFGSLSATINAGGTSFTGTGTDFGIGSDGSLVTLPGFGVSINFDTNTSGKVQWPSWLPIQIQTLAISWPNYLADPTNFDLDLSASVNVSFASGEFTISGMVTNAMIQPSLLASNPPAFPIVSVDKVGLSVSGQIGGATVSGGAFVAVLAEDASGKVIPDGNPDKIAVAKRIFYGGIEGSLTLGGAVGFGIRVGLSQNGPLSLFAEADVPILLDPVTGLSVTGLHGGIAFAPLTAPASPQDLATNDAYQPPGSQSLATWEAGLQTAVIAQAATNLSAPFAVLRKPFTIDAGATLFDSYATANAFSMAGDIQFDTMGKLLATGLLSLGGTSGLHLRAGAFLDLSQLAQHTKLMMFVQAPADTPILSIYGTLAIQVGGELDLNGVDSDASIANTPLSNSSFTVEFWSLRADSNTAETVVSQGGTAFTAGYDGSNHFAVTFGGKTLTSPSATDVSWHHWAITYDASSKTRTLYEDGVAVATDSGVNPVSTTDTTLLIGKSGHSYFKGSVDLFRVWNVARSATDIGGPDVLDSNPLTPTYAAILDNATPNLVGQWTFDSGSELADNHDSGHLLTIEGKPTWLLPITPPIAPPSWVPAGSTPLVPFEQGGFQIAVTGDAVVTVPSVPGGLDISGMVTFDTNVAQKSLDVTLSGSVALNPLGTLGKLAGNFHFDIASDGTPELYGAFDASMDISQVPALQSSGLTLAATVFVDFNTTGTIQHATLMPPGATSSTTYALAAQSVTLSIPDAKLGLKDVFSIDAAFYASFAVTTLPNGTLDPELDVTFNGKIAVGPASVTPFTLNAAGVLIINSAGLAASMNVMVNAALTGVTFDTSLMMTFNSSGTTQGFTVPNIANPNYNPNDPNDPTNPQYLAGSGQTYSIPGAFTLNGTTQTTGPYLAIVGSGDINVEKFALNGSFDLLVTQHLFRLDVNAMKVSVPGINFSLDASGGLMVSSAGIAGVISVTIPSGDGISGTDYQIDGSFTFAVNTTNADVSLAGVNVVANSAELAITGDAKVGPAGSQFDITGSLQILISGSGLTLDINGSANLGALGSLATTDSLTISSAGIVGDLNLSGTLTPISGTSFTGSFMLMFDTTQASPVVDLHIGGDLMVGGGFFDVKGTFDLHLANNNFSILGTGIQISLMKAVLGGGGFAAGIYHDSNGIAQLAIYIGLTFNSGALSGSNYTITASPSLAINTGSIPYSTQSTDSSVPATIPANSAQFELDNASVYAFGFHASGTLIAQVSNGGFDIQIPQSNPLTLSFLSLGSMQVYGDINSNGSFSITGVIKYDVTAGPFELYGGIGATITNTGFAAWFSGGANLDCGALGVFPLAAISASISISTSPAELDIDATATVLGITFPPFHESLGAYKAPTQVPGLAFYNVPATADAGGFLLPTAQVYDTSSNPLNTGDYDWVLTGPPDLNSTQNYDQKLGSTAPNFTLGNPGTYTLSLYDNEFSPHRLLKQSNINVVKLPPVLGSLNLPGAILTDTPFPYVMSPTYTVVNPANDYVVFSVTKNGVDWSSHVTVGPDFSLEFTPDPTDPSATHADNYVVKYTLEDRYNGPSATATAVFQSVDLKNLIVNSAADDTTYDAANIFPADGHITLRLAIDIINDNANNAGDYGSIRFDPSLAGKTIYLNKEELTYWDAPSADGFSDLGITKSIIIDGSNAPGLTISNATGSNRRLFYVAVGARLSLTDVNLVGGIAEGSGNAAAGGAIFGDGAVGLVHVGLDNNLAQGVNAGDNAHGGAVYAATDFSAYDSTFVNNTANGVGTGGGYGGAIAGEKALYLFNNTIAYNTTTGAAATGGGVYFYGAPNFEMYNNLVADNTGGEDFQVPAGNSAPSSGGYVGGDNYFATSFGVPFFENANSDQPRTFQLTYGQTNPKPMLGIAAVRGGLWSVSLLPNSPAIDAGYTFEAQYEAAIALDVRGLPRIVNGKVDVGSFESQPYLVTNPNPVGPGSLGEALLTDDDGQPIEFAPNLTGIALTYTTTTLTFSVGSNGQPVTTAVTNTFDNGPLTIAPIVDPLTHMIVNSNFTIIGPGDSSIGGSSSALTISGDNQNRIFLVDPGVTASISGLTLTDGLGINRGGAIYNAGGTLTLSNDVVSNNSLFAEIPDYGASVFGGAIYNDVGSTLNLYGDTFSGNVARGGFNGDSYSDYGYGEGGAIYNAPWATINGNGDTFNNNTAAGTSDSESYSDGYGGAIFINGSVTLKNVTMDGNAVLQGAGTTNLNPGYPTSGADIFNDSSGSLYLYNSIAANPIGGNDITNLANLNNFDGLADLVMSWSGLVAGAIASMADPNLLPLADYGGPTPTMVPRANSPAIGQGSSSFEPTTDQRGYSWTGPNQVDIGSVHSRQFIVTNLNESGPGSLRQAVNDDVDETPITFAPGLGGTINLSGGEIDITRDTVIVGPGANNLIIDAGGHSRIFNVHGVNVAISGVTIQNGGNVAQGGGIYNTGTLALDRDIFNADTATGDATAGLNGGGSGGAIDNAPGGLLTVTNSTFENNIAKGASFASAGLVGEGRGGAINNAVNGLLTVIDDTFASNTAAGGDGSVAGGVNGLGGYGGSIDNFGNATITNATFIGDAISDGANVAYPQADVSDLAITGGMVTLYNSILANATAGHDVGLYAGSITGGGNIASNWFGVANSLFVSSADPNLFSLGYDPAGGTPIFAEKPNSPALGAGILAAVLPTGPAPGPGIPAPLTDQRGKARIVGGSVDVGAYEVQAIPATPSAGGPYILHSGQTLVLNATGTLNLSNSSLTYLWTISNNTYFTSFSSGTSPTATFSTAGLAAGTYNVYVQTNDGYGGNHTHNAQTTLTVLPVLQPTGIAPASTAPAINSPFDSVDVTFSTPIDPSSLQNRGATFTLDGGPDLAHGSIFGLPLTLITATLVPGTTSTYRISGLAAIMNSNGQGFILAGGQGRYTLNVNGALVGDAYIGAGSGQVSASWIYDTTAPTSKVAPLPSSEPGPTFTVIAGGSDPLPRPGSTASGVATYDIYVSTDNGPFAYWTTVPALNPSAPFTGVGGNSYGFQSFARDGAGNLESKPQAVEAGTYVPIKQAPGVHVTSVNTSQQAFLVSFSGSAATGNTLDHVDLYASVDGGTPRPFAKVATAGGSATYEAIADGTSHTYAFYALGTDTLGNVQAVPAGPGYDLSVSANFAAPSVNLPIGLSINHGAPSRSFVRYADVAFDNSVGLASLIAGNDIQLVKHSLNGTGSTPVSLGGLLKVVDHAIEIDFGALGLGGNPDSTAGDGYYEIDINGVVTGQTQAFYFDRLFGDVKGDGVVDANDLSQITSALGLVVPGGITDIDGTGSVTTLNRLAAARAKNDRLAAGLHLDA